MYETYPKGSAHPSSKVGEQDTKATWPDSSKTEYGNTTAKDTVYNGDRVNTKRCEGGSGSANGPDYKPSREKFDSEIHVGK
jgi:hypothetical protein